MKKTKLIMIPAIASSLLLIAPVAANASSAPTVVRTGDVSNVVRTDVPTVKRTEVPTVKRTEVSSSFTQSGFTQSDFTLFGFPEGVIAFLKSLFV